MDSEPKRPSAVDAEGTPTPALTEKIIGAAIEVHRHTGPGLLDSASSARQSGEEGRSRPPLETLKTRRLSVSAVK